MFFNPITGFNENPNLFGVFAGNMFVRPIQLKEYSYFSYYNIDNIENGDHFYKMKSFISTNEIITIDEQKPKSEELQMVESFLEKNMINPMHVFKIEGRVDFLRNIDIQEKVNRIEETYFDRFINLFSPYQRAKKTVCHAFSTSCRLIDHDVMEILAMVIRNGKRRVIKVSYQPKIHL